MSWLLLVLASVVVYSFSVIFQKVLLRQTTLNLVHFSIVFQILTGVFLWLYASITQQITYLPLTGLYPNLLLLTILYGFGNIYIFKALQAGDASKFSILFAIRGLFTIVGSSLLLKEFLSHSQLLGALLIIVGIVIVNLNRHKFKFEQSDLYALTAALCFGLANTNDRYLLGSLNLYQYLTMAFIVPGIFIGFIYLKKLSDLTVFFLNGFWKKLVALSVIYALSAALFFGSLQLAPNSSQVASINLTSTILIAIMGIFVLQEKTNVVKKIIGALVSFLGLLLITQ